jgi:NAD(P)-dependent dehydrogenase (short-subunit alcohol dehydrogenase family)
MAGRLEGRVAIVTGAAGAIGRGVAQRYAEEGARLVLADIAGDGVRAVANQVALDKSSAVTVECDVSDESQIEATVRTALDEFGTIDILANLAQGGLGEHAYLEDVTAERALASLVTGPIQSMLFMSKCLPTMKQNGYGRIINFASEVALTGKPTFTHYAMAKAAIMALTRVASMEWARFGIVTNTVLPLADVPGAFTDDLGRAAMDEIVATIPVGRLGTGYDDIAPLMVFLASEEARYINGQAIGANGGNVLIA